MSPKQLLSLDVGQGQLSPESGREDMLAGQAPLIHVEKKSLVDELQCAHFDYDVIDMFAIWCMLPQFTQREIMARTPSSTTDPRLDCNQQRRLQHAASASLGTQPSSRNLVIVCSNIGATATQSQSTSMWLCEGDTTLDKIIFDAHAFPSITSWHAKTTARVNTAASGSPSDPIGKGRLLR